VVLVEGVSDQVAVEATAGVQGRDLPADGVVVLPIGGAQAIGNALEQLRQRAGGLVIGGLCDVAEEPYFRRAVTAAGLGAAVDRVGLARLGFFVCVEDLEDELIRAAGPDLIDRVMNEQGDRSSLRRAGPALHRRGGPAEAPLRGCARPGPRTGSRSRSSRGRAGACVAVTIEELSPQLAVAIVARVSTKASGCSM
jgi:hypothetical protein